MGSINLGPVHLDRFRYGPYGHCKSPHSYSFLSIPGNQCFLIRFHIWWNRLRGFSCRETWNVRPRNRFWLKSQKTRPARPFCRIQSHPNGVLHPVLSRVWFSLLKDSIGRWDCHVRPFATDSCDPFPFRGSAKKDKKAQPPVLVARCRKWQKASRVSTPTSSSRCMLGAQTSRLKEG